MYNHCIQYPPYEHIPHVFPDANLIYPCSPHVIPHEFLTFQTLLLIPTNKTQ